MYHLVALALPLLSSALAVAATTSAAATTPIPPYRITQRAHLPSMLRLNGSYTEHWAELLPVYADMTPYQQLLFSTHIPDLADSIVPRCTANSTCEASRHLFTSQLAYAAQVAFNTRGLAYALIAHHYGVICKAQELIQAHTTKGKPTGTLAQPPLPEGIDPEPCTTPDDTQPLADAQWYTQALHAHIATFPEHYRVICKAVATHGNVTPPVYERLAPQLKKWPEHPYSKALNEALTSHNVPRELIGIVMEYARMPHETFSFQEIAPFMLAQYKSLRRSYNFVGLHDIKGFHNWTLAISPSLECETPIEKISFESNYLTELPANEFDGASIPCNVLSFRSNQIRTAPATLVATCWVPGGYIRKQFTTLVLADNPIAELPQRFCDAIERKEPPNLENLDVRGCPLTPETHTAIQYACLQGEAFLFADELPKTTNSATTPHACIVS